MNDKHHYSIRLLIYATPAPTQTDAAEALVAVAPLATRWIERLLAAHEPPLRVSQYLALRAIAHEDISGTELARRRRLRARGLATARRTRRGRPTGAQPARGNQRRQTLSLSAAGEQAYRSADTLLRQRLAALLTDLPRPEADALSRALPRVESILSGAPPPRRPPATLP